MNTHRSRFAVVTGTALALVISGASIVSAQTDTTTPQQVPLQGSESIGGDQNGLTRRVTSSGQLTLVAAANALLHEGRDSSGNPTTRGPNGLIYRRDGVLVASVAQEGLVRIRKPQS